MRGARASVLLAVSLVAGCAGPPDVATHRAPRARSAPGARLAHVTSATAPVPRWAGTRGTPGEDRPGVERAAFARLLATIAPDTGASEVLDLLGPPGDVRTELDPGGIVACRTTEVWVYGADRHLGPGTLGTVHVQADGTVQYVFGGGGAPLVDPALPEADLRRLLRTLDAVRGYDGQSDPLRLVQAVNALWPLGRDRALAVISEYLRVSSEFESREGRDGVFLVLRLLFDPPPGEAHPPLLVGGPSPDEPDDPTLLPRFPLVLVDDVPVCVVVGYTLFGMAQPPEEHVEWYRAHGVLRPAPLAPPAAPLAALERFATAGADLLGLADARERDWFSGHVVAQARRLLATVLGTAPEARPSSEARDPPAPTVPWQRLREQVGPIVWDPASARYTGLDGSWVDATPRSWTRCIWRPEVDRGQVELILERSSAHHVQVSLVCSPPSACPGRWLTIEGPDGASLLRLDLGRCGSPGDAGTCTTGTSFEAAEGTPVRLSLTGRVDLRSDPLVP